MKVTIADYGVGNLHSLRKAFERLGATVEVTEAADRWVESQILVLPGVGAFGAVLKPIAEVRELLRQRVRERPTLGICLGMELLFERSEEALGVSGLRVLPGTVVKLPAQRLPHLGWNTVQHKQSGLFDEIPQNAYFYFVHSYGTLESDAALAWTVYESPIVSAVHAGPCSFGVQFHPEKSGQWGLKLLENFLALAKESR